MSRALIVTLLACVAVACASAPEPPPPEPESVVMAPPPPPPPVPVKRLPEPVPVARQLPKTAGPLPAIGLGGAAALLGAGLVRLVRRRL